MTERNGMIIKTNMSTVAANEPLRTFLELHRMFGLKVSTTERITAIGFDFGENAREDILSFQDMTMLMGIPSGVWIRNATLYTHIVAESKLSQSVPEDYPNSSITEGEEGSEVTRQKTWQEYTIAYPVEGGYLLRYCNGVVGDENSYHFNLLNDATMRLWDRDFGITVKRRAADLIAAYGAEPA